MRVFIVTLLLVSLCAPMTAWAREGGDCDVWLIIGDVQKWLACLAMQWVEELMPILDQWGADRCGPGQEPAPCTGV